MNKYIQFFPILLVLALMACTDYSEQINDSFEESRKSIRDTLCGDLWCGTDHSATFNVDGEWRWYTDDDEGGSTIFDFRIYDFADYVKSSAYVGGDYMLGGRFTDNNGKEQSPYASVVADFKKMIDVTSWKGVCVVYASTSQIRLMLGFEGEKAFDYDRPMYWLDKTTIGLDHYVKVDIAWESFKTTGWYKGTSVDVDYALTVANGFDFQFAKPGSDDSGSFRIYSIGRLGTCN